MKSNAFLKQSWIVLLALALVPAAVSAQSHPAPPKYPREAPQETPAPAKPAQPANPLADIPIPPLPPFHPQEPKRIVLPNGLVVFLQVDHELPLISGTMRIRGGSVDDPAGKIGLSDVYGSVWRTGGTTARTGDQLDDFLEIRAAKLETDTNPDSSVISFSCLKGDFDDVFSAFQELLFHPEFRQDKLELAKRQLYGLIARRNDDVDEIVGREAVKLAYGAHNPYALDDEFATVAAITRQDLLNWHAKYVHPQNAIFGITGDFDPDVMEKRIRDAFANWQKGPEAPRPKVEFAPAAPGYYFIAKTDVNQTSVQMVALGIERSNPDFYAVSVMNEILSGGFSSRLINNLRSRLGLAYSVSGNVGSAWDHPGISEYGIATKSSTTKEAIEGLRNELNNLLSDPPSELEMRRAKDAILNSFVFNFDSKQKVLLEKMRYEFYGYPLDFLDRYRDSINKVTVADVNRVAHKYVHPEQLAVLVVGNPREIGNQLTSLGPVRSIDISIPPPPAGLMGKPQPTSEDQ